MKKFLLAATGLPLALACAVPALAAYTVNDALCVNGTSPDVSAKDCGYPVGSAAAKNLGTSVADPGTGTLETLIPIQTVTGASKTYGQSDLFVKTRRSNSGAAMTDTLPVSTTTGLADGTELHITNVDASASDTLTAGAGTTVAGASAYVVPAGRDIWLTYDSANTDWKLAANTGSAVIGPSSATANDIAVYADTTGKLVQDGGKTLPSGAIVGTTDTQTLTNKSIAAGEITGVSGIAPITYSGGAIGLGVDSNFTTNGSHNLALASVAAGNILANATGSSAEPVSTTLSAEIDQALGNTQGDVLYRGASGWSVLAPATANQSLQTGGASANPAWASPVATFIGGQTNSNVSAGATDYLTPFQSAGPFSSEPIVPWAMGGTFRTLYCKVSSAPGTGNSVTFTLRVNGASPSNGPVCTISGTNTSNSDTTHTATITAGQTVDMQVVYSASATASIPAYSATFTTP